MPSKQSQKQDWRATFFASLAEPLKILDLFEYLPQVYMYVKDREGRYVRANRVACSVMGAADETEVVGKVDFDFFPPAVAAQYVAEDRRVIAAGKPLMDQAWLVPGAAGLPQWFLCSKIPLLNHEGEIAGIAGVKRPYAQTSSAPSGYGRLLRVVEFVSTHYNKPIEVADLAEHVNLSVSQLQREFSRLFTITPSQYIREVRIGVARHRLETSDDRMSQVSSDCGFYDQSHFTRQFRASTGMTPLEYRHRYHPSFSPDD